ncbi:MAG: TonB-dependent receptor, partial [Candidatus Latescibacterota bacterium]
MKFLDSRLTIQRWIRLSCSTALPAALSAARRACRTLIFGLVLATVSEPDVQAHSAKTDAPSVPDTLYTVPAIIIEAPRVTRVESDVFNRSGFVAVVDMGPRQNRVEDLSSVLSRMVGVRVREYGGLGGFATVSIRGSSSNQVDVFLDGVPISDAYTGTTNIAELPLGGVKRIEVYRGFTPPHLGSTAIGGAVNLNTVDSKNWLGVTAFPLEEGFGSYGSFDTSRLVLSLWSRLGALRLFAHAGRLTSEGNFTFEDNAGTPENPDDDRRVERVNNDIDSWNALGRVIFELPIVGDVSLSHNYLSRDQGVPGIGSHQSLSARSRRERHLTYLQAGSPGSLAKRLDIAAMGFYSWTNEVFLDLEGDIGLRPQQTDNVFSTSGGSLRSRLDVPALPVELEAYVDGRYETFTPGASLPVPTSGPDMRRTSTTAAVYGDLFLSHLRAVLTASGRMVSHTSEFYDPPRFPWLPPTPQGKINRNDHTPQLGFRFMPTSFLSVKANWGRYVRLPTFVELFGNTGSVTGSADLVPEESLNRDIGVVVSHDRLWRLRRMFFEVVYLDNDVENLIIYFPNSQFTAKPRNIGAARIRGVE